MVRAAFSSVLGVTLDGRPLSRTYAPLLVGGWIDQGVGVPAAFRLTFRDPRHLLLRDLRVEFGTEVVLTPIADGEGVGNPLLTGEVTGMETDYDGVGTFTVIRGYDPGHRLMRSRRVAAYRNQSAADIARRLAARDGVALGRIQPTRTVYDFISQSNISDWDFLSRLADENEMVMSLDARGRFRFERPDPAAGAPPTSTPGSKSSSVLQGGVDILSCRAAVTAADQVATVESRGWDVTTKREVVGTSPARTNPGIRIGTTPGEAATAFRGGKLVETDRPYDRQPEVRNAAAALSDDVTAAFAELELTVHGNPELRPGMPVTLTDVGEPFEGKYTVTSVRHVFGEGQPYRTSVTVSGRQWRSLYGLASGGATTAAPRLPGVANALVTDVDDPLKQGRVRLRFPWLDDTYVSDWTRTVQLGGLDGGGIFPLDVNDEVLVAFDRGALDHPFVIGGLYNGRDTPTRVADVPLHDTVRKKASRHTVSDRDGNRMDLLSQKTAGRKQGVRLISGDDRLTITLDRTRTEIVVDSDGDVTIKGGRSVSVEAGTDLTLSARRNLTIKSGGTLSVEGGGMVSVNSLGGAVNVDAVGALSLKALGATTISSGGTVQVNAVANVGIRAATLMLQGVVMVNNKPYPIP